MHRDASNNGGKLDPAKSWQIPGFWVTLWCPLCFVTVTVLQQQPSVVWIEVWSWMEGSQREFRTQGRRWSHQHHCSVCNSISSPGANFLDRLVKHLNFINYLLILTTFFLACLYIYLFQGLRYLVLLNIFLDMCSLLIFFLLHFERGRIFRILCGYMGRVPQDRRWICPKISLLRVGGPSSH